LKRRFLISEISNQKSKISSVLFLGAACVSERLASSSVAVVGVGNPLMGDDGVGIAVIRELGKESLPSHVELFDAGTALLDILPEVAHCERIILVDCCRAGGEPGTLYRTPMQPDHWRTEPPGASLHELNVVHALQLHRIGGGKLNEVILIGIEPAEVALREGLSPAVRDRLPAIVAAVRRECEVPADGQAGEATPAVSGRARTVV
jgi:hydrogenase maturation protease